MVTYNYGTGVNWPNVAGGTGINTGADSITLTDNNVRPTGQILAGYGADTVTITNSTMGDLWLYDGRSSGAEFVAGGAGNNDTLTITNSTVGRIHLGTGSQVINITNSQTFNLDWATGNVDSSTIGKLINLDNTDVVGIIAMETIGVASDNDTINIINGSNVTRWIKGDSGNDIINVQGSTVGVAAVGPYAVADLTSRFIDAGTGNDTVTLNNSFVGSNVQLGDGDDVANLTSSTVGAAALSQYQGDQNFAQTFIAGGAGDDRFNINNLTLLGTQGVMGQDGDDTYVVTAFSASNLFINGNENAENGNAYLPGNTTDTDPTNDANFVGDILDLRSLNGQVTVVYTSANKENGYVTYNSTLGITTTLTFQNIEKVLLACFVSGTMIETKNGLVAIEALQIGDLVKTADHGFQAISWVGHKVTDATSVHAPIVFKAGSIGNSRDLLVSPQHKMLISDWRAEVLFDSAECLVAAVELVNGDTIYQSPRASVEYFHIMFDQHEIVFAEGVASESFFPGEYIVGGMDEATRNEIFAIFPELKAGFNNYGDSARVSITGRDLLVFNSL